MFENILTLIAAMTVFLIAVASSQVEAFNQYRIIAFILLAVMLIAMHPFFQNIFFRLLNRFLRKPIEKYEISYFNLLKLLFGFVLNWMIAGWGFYFLAKSIAPEINASQFLYLTGLFGLSVFIGMVSLFAPSGIGVREGILVLGLTPILSAQSAVVISLVARIWSMIPEVLLAVFAMLIEKFKKAEVQK